MFLDCIWKWFQYKSHGEVDAMSSGSIKIAASAPAELEGLVETVARIHRDYRVSFIAAGDERIYAYGGRGFVAVLSDREFEGLVEIETPTGTLRIAPNLDGEIEVVAAGEDARPVGARFVDARAKLDGYYARRYWKP
jgi:hypothetical protein